MIAIMSWFCFVRKVVCSGFLKYFPKEKRQKESPITTAATSQTPKGNGIKSGRPEFGRTGVVPRITRDDIYAVVFWFWRAGVILLSF
jgi:hypothetical protein